MINTEESNKEVARGAGFYSQRPDSNAICESLVSKLTEKSDDEPKEKSNVKPAQRSGKKKPEDMSETEDSEKGDESDWSSAPASPAPLKTPRAFEKSDHLYEKQMEKEALEESEDWSWETEEFLQEDNVVSKDTDNSYKP